MAAVSLFTRTPGSTIQHAINEATEQPSVSELVGTQAARVLWGDAVATSVAIGGGAAMATLNLAQGVGVTTINVGTAANPAINLGGAASLVTVNGNAVVQGDLTVNGTTTALNTVNVTITDAILLIAAQSVPAPQTPSAWTIERGTSGDDALVYWNTTNDRFELGLFDTVGGTVAPAGALAVTTDLRLEDLIVAGTTITGEGALSVTATAADLDLAATGANVVNTQTNGLTRWFAASDGGQEYVGLAANPSVSAAGDAKLIYNSTSNTLRVSLSGAAYVDLITSTTVSLQGAYNVGSSIATSTAQGTITFSGSAANNDNVLSVAKTPAGAQTGSALVVSSNANASSTTFTVTRAAAAGLSALFSGGSISCPDGAGSERFGDSSTAAGVASSAFGASSTASGASSAAFGSVTTASGASSAAFGSSTAATAGQTTALGVAANAAVAGATAVGQAAAVVAGATADSIALGRSASFTAVGGGVAIGNQPIGFTNVVCIGLGSGVGGLGSTVVGDNAVTGAAGGTAFGASAAANVVDGIAVGNTSQILAGATASSIVVGSSFAAAGGGVVVGTFGAVAFTGVVGVGLGSTISAAGTVMVGSAGSNAGTNAVAVGRGIAIGNVTGAVAIGNAPAIPTGATAASIVVSGSGTGGFSATGGGVILGGGAGATTFVSTVIVGLLSSVTGTSATVVGAAAISGASGFAGGAGSVASTNGVAVGASASDSFGASIVLGASAVNTATGQFIAGSAANPITLMVIGAGVTAVSPSATVTWRTTDAAAASAAAGSNLAIRAGNGDGAGANGVLSLAAGTGGTGGGQIELQTVGASQWQVSGANGDLLTSALNDIGDLANTARPATIYAGTAVVVGTTVTINTNSVVGSTVLSVTATTLDLNLSATAGSVVVTGAEAVADAIQLTASNAAGGLDLNAGTGGVTIDAVGAGAAISLDAVGASNFTVSGATADLTLGARAATITLNEAGNTTLVSFTATSIIGALNELKSTPSGTTFTAAVALSLGQATYISATNSVDKATGTADNALARVIGLAQAAIGAAATGKIVTEGAATGLFVAGLTLAAGDEIFLSLTAGSLTNDVSAFVAGNVIQSVGYLKDPLTYNGIGDLLAQVQLVRGPRLVL
jgi:hypothetical protein